MVMGHIDHGKTTLLDYIRKANIAEKEAGGITQSVGAYEITWPQSISANQRKAPRGSALPEGKRITFIDTPGHEAFSKMRERGAKVADISILVVAADESVKPQTKEALSHIQTTETPFLVAITKADKPEANPDKVKQDLSKEGVLVEGWGGKIPVALVSTKTGEGVNNLLDLILLLAELEELKASPQNPARGVVIESRLDRKRGPTATLLILDGTLKKGDQIFAGEVFGKVKLLENFLGEPVESLSFSSPAVVLGWEDLPKVGEEFFVSLETKSRAKAKASLPRSEDLGEIKDQIPLLLKADVAGSLEALSEAVVKLSEEKSVPIKILFSQVGDINDSDVRLADATKALIVGFRIKISREAEGILKTLPEKIFLGEVIYELLDSITKVFEEWLEKQKAAAISGRLEVLAIFDSSGPKQVIGGEVKGGKLLKGEMVSIFRRGSKIAEGKITNLQKDRKDVSEVTEGEECGILFDAPITIAKGDILEATG